MEKLNRKYTKLYEKELSEIDFGKKECPTFVKDLNLTSIMENHTIDEIIKKFEEIKNEVGGDAIVLGVEEWDVSDEIYKDFFAEIDKYGIESDEEHNKRCEKMKKDLYDKYFKIQTDDRVAPLLKKIQDIRSGKL